MSDKFDKIVDGFEDGPPEFASMDEVMAYYYPRLVPGAANAFLTKYVLIAEELHGNNRGLRYQSSDASSEWDILGMMESVRQQVTAVNVLDQIAIAVDEDDEE